MTPRRAGLCLCAAALTGGCGPGDPAPGAQAERPAPRTPSDADYEIRLWANRLALDRQPEEAAARLRAAGAPAALILAEMLPSAAGEARARVAAVLGDIGAASAVPALIACLPDEGGAARKALARIAGMDLGERRAAWEAWWRDRASALPEAERRAIRDAFRKEPFASRQEIVRGLVRELGRDMVVTRREAPDDRFRPAARSVDASTPEEIRRRHAAVPILEEVLEEGDPSFLIHVVPFAKEIGRPAAGALRAALGSRRAEVRTVAARALAELGEGAGGAGSLADLLRDPDPGARIEAARALADAEAGPALDALKRAIGPEDPVYPAALVTRAILSPELEAEALLARLREGAEGPVWERELTRWASRHFAVSHAEPKGDANLEEAFRRWLSREGLLRRGAGDGARITVEPKAWEGWWASHRSCRRR